jgi:hypothetical protein
MGAGDCRLARDGHFERYTGIEIDKKRVAMASPPENGIIINECAFRHRLDGYDACIGNPPYVRHHDVESPWKERTVRRIEQQLGIVINKHCNLYLYFMCLGLLKSRHDGILSLIIPYEWVSRPSAEAIRKYIQQKKWGVAVYRFKTPIFDGVLTTASVSIIDKRCNHGEWSYFDISSDCKIEARPGVADSENGVLEYAKRGNVWAMRGLSPGSQEIFALTEGERVHHGLKKHDVIPCVTTLKNLPRNITILSKTTFKKHLVETGERCWLVKSYKKKRSNALDAYLSGISFNDRDTYTCRNQKPWFNYALHPTPQLLIGSGFTKFGPKVLINSICAKAVGSVFGIHGAKRLPLRRIQRHLLEIDFEKQVVAHARTLKKVEVKQFNAVLNEYFAQKRK